MNAQQSANASPELAALIESHRHAMLDYERIPDEEWDEVGNAIVSRCDATRDAVMKRRPASLAEVRIKAEYMAGCKSFTEWDDLDPLDLIKALTPEGAVS